MMDDKLTKAIIVIYEMLAMSSINSISVIISGSQTRKDYGA